MKTFDQFKEDVNNLETTLKTFATDKMKPKLKGIAKDVSKNVDVDKLKNTINTTVIDKLTGGETGREKMVKKVGDNFEKASKNIPNALNRFNDFLNSGTIERKMSHLQSKFSSLENENKRQDRNMKKDLK